MVRWYSNCYFVCVVNHHYSYWHLHSLHNTKRVPNDKTTTTWNSLKRKIKQILQFRSRSISGCTQNCMIVYMVAMARIRHSKTDERFDITDDFWEKTQLWTCAISQKCIGKNSMQTLNDRCSLPFYTKQTTPFYSNIRHWPVPIGNWERTCKLHIDLTPNCT